MPSQSPASWVLPAGGPAAVAAQGAPPSAVVRGPRRLAAVVGLWIQVAWLALRTYRDPIRAARALRRVRAAPPAPGREEGAPARLRLWTSQKCVFSSGRWFWDLYAPGWPSAAFDRCARMELARADRLGRPPAPVAAIVAITRRCGLRCEHCAESDALGDAESLSHADLHEIVLRLRRRGVVQLFLGGGEPLQRFDDLRSLAASASADTDVWVLTSGLGLSADRAQRLGAAGATGVVLSLDHWDAAAHDGFRGTPGSFAAVGRAARNARDAGLLVALSLCPTRDFVTAANLARYAETARSLGAGFIQIVEPRPMGRYAGRDVALGPAQQRLLEEFAARLDQDPAARDLPAVRYLDWTTRTSGCCGAGDRYVYVDTRGELHPCPFCRVPGLRVLGGDFDAALSALRSAGCPSRAPGSRPTRRT